MGEEGLLVSFGSYLIVLVAVGIIGYRLTKTFSDFILAGRRLGAWVVAISAQASDMSGWLLLGFLGEVITNGVSMVWVAIGLSAGTFFNWTILVFRLIAGMSEMRDLLTSREG